MFASLELINDWELKVYENNTLSMHLTCTYHTDVQLCKTCGA